MKRINIFIIFSAVVAGLVLAQPAAAQFLTRQVTARRFSLRQLLRFPILRRRQKLTPAPLGRKPSIRLSRRTKTPKPARSKNSRSILLLIMPTAKNNPQPQAQKTQEPFRRYSQVGGITVETTEDHPEDELIMLFMRDFSIYRSPSGRIRCSARFAVMTTLPVKLSNISYRLKWPGMETVLTFSDVEPGVENHFDYGLLGDGCYSMDKQPNIIVNRCRVKGMTQRQCAAKIRWLKEI